MRTCDFLKIIWFRAEDIPVLFSVDTVSRYVYDSSHLTRGTGGKQGQRSEKRKSSARSLLEVGTYHGRCETPGPSPIPLDRFPGECVTRRNIAFGRSRNNRWCLPCVLGQRVRIRGYDRASRREVVFLLVIPFQDSSFVDAWD